MDESRIATLIKYAIGVVLFTAALIVARVSVSTTRSRTSALTSKRNYKTDTVYQPKDVHEVVIRRYQLESRRDLANGVLFARMTRRTYDGLIAIRPVIWYIYYIRGGSFYYLSSHVSVQSSVKCASSETSCILFDAIEPNDRRNVSKFRFGCLNVPFLSLLTLLSKIRGPIDDNDDTCATEGTIDVKLDELLERTNVCVNAVTVLNHLITVDVL